MKNMPAAALDNPFAKQQKMLLYVLPVVFAVSGVNFPIGVLLYWLTTNVWSMGQQFYVIRRMPAPGSPAERALQERRRKHGHAPLELETDDDATPAVPSGQRVQPKRQARSKRAAKAGDGTPSTPDASAGESSGVSLTKDAGDLSGQSSQAPAPVTEGQKPAGKKTPGKAGKSAAAKTAAGKAAADKASGKTTAGKKPSSPAKQGATKKRTKPASGSKPGQRPR
jgi:YidC/Oxa1 family membrane protein insertase